MSLKCKYCGEWFGNHRPFCKLSHFSQNEAALKEGQRQGEREWADRWRRKQELAKPSRYYGDGGTIHSSGELDVETHNGKVVAVWFRCATLPFKQVEVGNDRAKEMCLNYNEYCGKLTGVEILDG